MRFLNNFVYLLVLVAALPWLVYCAIRKGKYREGLAAKLLGSVPRRTGNRKCIWLHAVSVGEIKLLDVVIKEISRRAGDWECVISTTTKTGYALAKEKYQSHTVFYCPLDFSWAVTRAMRRIRPDMLVLAELELWPNLIGAASRHGAKVAVINGRMSPRSFRGYRLIRPVISRVLREIDLLAVQTEEYAQRYRLLGASAHAVQVTGSLKFDGVQTDRSNPQTVALRGLAGISDDDIVFLAGSTVAPEESLALVTFRCLCEEFPRLKFILVPRHPERFAEVGRLLEKSRMAWRRRSELKPADPPARILLIDTIGELSAWWGTAMIAFVGGSLDGHRGGQNMLEPAAYGAAVLFGPYTENFKDVVGVLLSRRAAVVVNDGDELTAQVRQLLQQTETAAELGTRAREVVQESKGATARTVSWMMSVVTGSGSKAGKKKKVA